MGNNKEIQRQQYNRTVTMLKQYRDAQFFIQHTTDEESRQRTEAAVKIMRLLRIARWGYAPRSQKLPAHHHTYGARLAYCQPERIEYGIRQQRQAGAKATQEYSVLFIPHRQRHTDY